MPLLSSDVLVKRTMISLSIQESREPPLQYYLRVLEERPWDRVDVVTNGFADATHGINPVVPALESKVANGELAGHIHFYKVCTASHRHPRVVACHRRRAEKCLRSMSVSGIAPHRL